MSLPQPSADVFVVVTGAASGIGEQFARQLSERGYPLLLVDRQADALEAVAAELDADHEVCDLAVTEQRVRLIARVQRDPRGLAGLCNNAGIMLIGGALELGGEAQEAQVAVNTVAVHHLAIALLPLMVARGEGALLNVASLAANQPLPGMAGYAATKAFVHTLSEGLHVELAGTGVSSTSLCPGATATHLIDTEGGQRASRIVPGLLWAEPEDVARAGIEGMLAGRRTVVPGIANRAVLAPLGRFAPRGVGLPVIGGTLRRLLANPAA